MSFVDHSEPGERAAGDSAEQRDAEEYLVARLGEKLGVTLAKKEFALPGGEWLEIDGACQTPLILCEAWAIRVHQRVLRRTRSWPMP